MPINAVTSHTISIQHHYIHYLERKGQTSDSPLLILFHGFPENAHAWEALINALPTDYHVIAPDLPGYHTLSAMLNYYREMPQMAPEAHAPEAELTRLRVPNIRVTLPTLVLWGRLDDAFDEGILDGLATYVPDLRIVYHDTATHWVHREQATWAAKQIVGFILASKADFQKGVAPGGGH